jgi:kynureninase
VPRRKADPGRDRARALDAADELAAFRRRFELPHRDRTALVYLCGHSLGLMPHSARAAVERELDRWAALGVDGHLADASNSGWLDYHEHFAKPLAALAGANAGEVVAMNTLTVNLHLMLVSFFRPGKDRRAILIERDAFGSDRYAVQSQLRHHGLQVEQDLLEVAPNAVTGRLELADYRALLEQHGERIALVLLPGVQYLTGERLDLAAFTDLAHRFGCRIGFDLAHAIGNVPLALHDSGADFAVWCSYKYLNAGPGAVGGCFVHERWADAPDLPRFAGWWGHDRATRFAMPRAFQPLAGAAGWQLSNPPILSLAPLAASLDLFAAAGFAKLRRKSERLTSFLEHELDAQLGERVSVLTPPEPERRGCQVSIAIQSNGLSAAAVSERLHALGVVADARAPNVLRIAAAPLYNCFADVHAAARALRQALDS